MNWEADGLEMRTAVRTAEEYRTAEFVVAYDVSDSGSKELFDLNPEVDWSERLRHERVCATHGGPVCHLRLCVCGQHEHLDISGFWLVSEPAQDFPPVEAWEANIEYDDMRIGSVDLVQSGDTVHRARHFNLKNA